MKNKNYILIFTILIVIFSIVSSLVGLLSSGGVGKFEFTTVDGKIVDIFGVGLYWKDSISIVAQGKASDLITLVFAIPSLIFSLVLFFKGSFKGKVMLTGLTAYFLYTYMSYVFLWMFNPLFIVYVLLMSLSFFSLIFLMTSFEYQTIKERFTDKLPIKIISIYQIIIGMMIGFLWLGMIIPSMINGKSPEGLDHYTTLVIQAMDLGFIVPLSIISGFLLLKKKPFGYILSSIILVKGCMMLLSISAMNINQLIHSIDVNIFIIVIFSLFTITSIIMIFILMKNIKERKLNEA